MNRKTYFTTIADIIPADGLQYVQRAYYIVKDAHRKQSRRLTGERYFEHVRRVSYLAGVTFGYNDAYTIALGLLHDIIEDTFVPTDIIVNLFGQAMYNDILVLSKELPSFNPITGELIARAKINDDQYYGTLGMASKRPRVVKGCDRIDNLTDLSSWEEARRNKYIAETNNRILPIVRPVDARITHMIEELVTAKSKPQS